MRRRNRKIKKLISGTGNGFAYAPLYCATSSPRINTFSLLASSSARASFKASRTVTLTPASVAYLRERRIEGAQTDCWKAGRRGVEVKREESRRAAGRKSRGAAMTEGKGCGVEWEEEESQMRAIDPGAKGGGQSREGRSWPGCKAGETKRCSVCLLVRSIETVGRHD